MRTLIKTEQLPHFLVDELDCKTSFSRCSFLRGSILGARIVFVMGTIIDDNHALLQIVQNDFIFSFNLNIFKLSLITERDIHDNVINKHE